MFKRPRLRDHFVYHRVPCDPPPLALADLLAEAKVAAAAAKRIDTFERYHQQHRDHHVAQVKVVLGAVGLVLSVGPSVPGAIHSCAGGAANECASRVSALVGALIAMGVTAWSFYDLYVNPSRLTEQIAKLNEEIARTMVSKNGNSAVNNLLDLYRAMSREERQSFKALLHERAREPRMADVVRRVMRLRTAGQDEASVNENADVRIDLSETSSLA